MTGIIPKLTLQCVRTPMRAESTQFTMESQRAEKIIEMEEFQFGMNEMHQDVTIEVNKLMHTTRIKTLMDKGLQ